ncbi:hypothetical protein [Dactylosporangium cerinum]
MLAQVHGARTVQSDLATLSLDEQFPVVLVAGARLNTADETLRTALLATCRRHVTPSGQVIMNWLPPSWFSNVTSSTGRIWPVEVSFSVESFDGTVLHAHSTYRLANTTWEQRTTVRRLSRADLHTTLANADLRLTHHLHGGRHFFSAVPSPTPPGDVSPNPTTASPMDTRLTTAATPPGSQATGAARSPVTTAAKVAEPSPSRR